MSKGPIGWIIGGIAATAVAAILAGVTIAAAAKKSAAAEEQETIEENTADLEAISENQELAGSVRDLTKEYKELSDAGLDASSSLNELKKQVPDLI
jgi:gas vesicle protein